MTPEERALIDGLFDRMRDVQNQPRDPEAEALIARRVAEAPEAPYVLAQSVLVQEHALQQAYARVQELEAEVHALQAQAAEQPQQGGSFLGGLFGGGRASVPSAGSRGRGAIPSRSLPQGGPMGAPMGVPPGYAQQQGGYPPAYGQAGGPWGAQPQPQARGGFGGGGFLQGALATAAGVAGGALLYDGIKNMMSGGDSPIAHQAAAQLPQGGGEAGNLGTDAQAALGGAPDDQQFAAGGDTSGWADESQGGGFDNASFEDDGGYDDGGWDAGGDDGSWT